MTPAMRGWILLEETSKSNYWEFGPVLGAEVEIWVPFPHKLQVSLSGLGATAMGRSHPACPQIHSTDQGTQHRLQAPRGHLTTTTTTTRRHPPPLWPHPVKGATTHNAHLCGHITQRRQIRRPLAAGVQLEL